MATGFFEIGMSKIGYHRWGVGSRLLIAFHGFGDNSSSFEDLAKELETDFVTYAVNLPWHGNSIWMRESFDDWDIKWIIDRILEVEQKDRFDMLGHSFGARLILRLLPDFTGQLDGLHLAAADGLRSVWMYRLKFIPDSIHRYLQKRLIRPDRLLNLLNGLQRLGLMKKFSYKFAEYHLATPMRRRRLFCFWLSLRYFSLDRKKLWDLLNQNHHIPLALYMGKRDQIIPYEAAEAFVKKVPHARLFILDRGHKVLDKTLGRLISEQLTGKAQL